MTYDAAGDLALPHACGWMAGQVAEPRSPVRYVAWAREYVVDDVPPSAAAMLIEHCPGCGERLPTSLRDAWFDRFDADPPSERALDAGAWWRSDPELAVPVRTVAVPGPVTHRRPCTPLEERLVAHLCALAGGVLVHEAFRAGAVVTSEPARRRIQADDAPARAEGARGSLFAEADDAVSSVVLETRGREVVAVQVGVGGDEPWTWDPLAMTWTATWEDPPAT